MTCYWILKEDLVMFIVLATNIKEQISKLYKNNNILTIIIYLMRSVVVQKHV